MCFAEMFRSNLFLPSPVVVSISQLQLCTKDLITGYDPPFFEFVTRLKIVRFIQYNNHLADKILQILSQIVMYRIFFYQ